MSNQGTDRATMLRILDIVTEVLEHTYDDRQLLTTRGAAARIRVARSLLKSLKKDGA